MDIRGEPGSSREVVFREGDASVTGRVGWGGLCGLGGGRLREVVHVGGPEKDQESLNVFPAGGVVFGWGLIEVRVRVGAR